MDSNIEQFITELTNEWSTEYNKNLILFQRSFGSRGIPTVKIQYPFSFRLNSANYAEWRQKVKKYITLTYKDCDLVEILELLGQKDISSADGDRLVGLLKALANNSTASQTNNLANSGIFISHSHLDIDLVSKIMDFFQKVGINRSEIFCSSIEGQGVKNGERIEEVVREKIISAKLIFYVVTQNFLQSNYCMQELGAGWILRDDRVNGKKIFLLKIDDVENDDIKGFVNSDFKYSELNQDSLMGLIDDVSELFNIENRKATQNNYICKSLLDDTKNIITAKVEQSKLSREESTKALLEKLHNSIKNLTPYEKTIIAEIYCSNERCIDLDITNGTTAQLERRYFIMRLTEISSIGYCFSYGLQDWLLQYIEEHSDFAAELKRIFKKNHRNDPLY